jgi:hypothetical protein
MIRLKDILKDTLSEAKYEDIAVWPAKNTQRGTSESGARSFDINIGNPDVIRKMAKTAMGEPGMMKSFKYEGPAGDTFKEFEWDAETTQWEVWKNMNYVILTPDNHVHWYHGKMPGGIFKDETGKLLPGATGTPLPDLTIKGFGFKVYKALLLDPTVGYIFSDKSSTPEIKQRVYGQLMNDKDFIWITTNGNTYDSYDEIVIINPLYSNVENIKQNFETKNKGAKIFYSKNFPNLSEPKYDWTGIDTPGDPTM